MLYHFVVSNVSVDRSAVATICQSSVPEAQRCRNVVGSWIIVDVRQFNVVVVVVIVPRRGPAVTDEIFAAV
jgi:hypothetical protein